MKNRTNILNDLIYTTKVNIATLQRVHPTGSNINTFEQHLHQSGLEALLNP